MVLNRPLVKPEVRTEPFSTERKNRCDRLWTSVGQWPMATELIPTPNRDADPHYAQNYRRFEQDVDIRVGKLESEHV